MTPEFESGATPVSDHPTADALPGPETPWGSAAKPPCGNWIHAVVLLGGTAGLAYIYRRFFMGLPVAAGVAFDIASAALLVLYCAQALDIPLRSPEIEALQVMLVAVISGRYLGQLVHVTSIGSQVLWLRPTGPRDVLILNWLTGASAFLVLIPFAVILLIRRRRLSDYGLCWGDWRRWGPWVCGGVAIMIPILWFATGAFRELQTFYPMVRGARASLGAFVVFQCFVVLLMFGWEFSLRGYLQFALQARLGLMAVVVQNVPFVLGHVRKPESELYGTLVSGLFLGYIAYRGRSMLPALITHVAVAVINDAMVIAHLGGFRH